MHDVAIPARSVNRLPLAALLTANAISGAGNTISRLAIPWFVLATTGSAARTGIVAAVELTPLIVAGILGGTLVDRIGFKRTSVVSDIASGATVAIIPALYYTIGLEFWLLLVLVFAGALLDAPGRTARRSFIPELADAAGMPLARANGFFGAIERSTGLLGPPLAGLFIAFVGAAPLLWINAASFAVSAALVLALVPSSLQPAADPLEPAATYRADLIAGFRWIWGDALIRTLVVMILVTNFIESPLIIVMTVYARDVLDSAVALGLIIGVFSIGAIVGSMASGAVVERLPRRAIMPLGFSSIIILYGVLLTEPPLVVILATALVDGLIAGPINPFLDTVFQERVPARMRGRVFGLRSALMMAAMPIGILVGGTLISTSGIRTALVIQMIAMLLAVGWMVISPTLRQVDD